MARGDHIQPHTCGWAQHPTVPTTPKATDALRAKASPAPGTSGQCSACLLSVLEDVLPPTPLDILQPHTTLLTPRHLQPDDIPKRISPRPPVSLIITCWALFGPHPARDPSPRQPSGLSPLPRGAQYKALPLPQPPALLVQPMPRARSMGLFSSLWGPWGAVPSLASASQGPRVLTHLQPGRPRPRSRCPALWTSAHQHPACRHLSTSAPLLSHLSGGTQESPCHQDPHRAPAGGPPFPPLRPLTFKPRLSHNTGAAGHRPGPQKAVWWERRYLKSSLSPTNPSLDPERDTPRPQPTSQPKANADRFKRFR